MRNMKYPNICWRNIYVRKQSWMWLENTGFLVYKVIKFLRGHGTWETLYLHYLCNNVLHLDVSHLSAHEGTNHGLKSHSCAIKPVMNLDTSANTLNIQSSIKVKECEEIISRDATRTHKRWSDLPTSRHTTSFGEGIFTRNDVKNQ